VFGQNPEFLFILIDANILNILGIIFLLPKNGYIQQFAGKKPQAWKSGPIFAYIL